MGVRRSRRIEILLETRVVLENEPREGWGHNDGAKRTRCKLHVSLT